MPITPNIDINKRKPESEIICDQANALVIEVEKQLKDIQLLRNNNGYDQQLLNAIKDEISKSPKDADVVNTEYQSLMKECKNEIDQKILLEKQRQKQRKKLKKAYLYDNAYNPAKDSENTSTKKTKLRRSRML